MRLRAKLTGGLDSIPGMSAANGKYHSVSVFAEIETSFIPESRGVSLD
jgi:hypothetical protein